MELSLDLQAPFFYERAKASRWLPAAILSHWASNRLHVALVLAVAREQDVAVVVATARAAAEERSQQ